MLTALLGKLFGLAEQSVFQASAAARKRIAVEMWSDPNFFFTREIYGGEVLGLVV
jgi:hypothetical protein